MKVRIVFLFCTIIFLSSCLKSRAGQLEVKRSEELISVCNELRQEKSLVELFAKVRQLQASLDRYYDLDNPENYSSKIESLVFDLKQTAQTIKSKLKAQYTEPIYEAQYEWRIPTSKLLNRIGVLKVHALHVDRVVEGGSEVDQNLRPLEVEVLKRQVIIKMQKIFSALELCELRGANYINGHLEYEIMGHSIFDVEKNLLLQY